MIRVIIADDENRICKLIMKLIDWDQIGMLIVGTASNGMEALELIEKEKPDIVITDIRMPGYDGLEMIEKAKSINHDLEFIIISGYGQFEYAKKAIEYGVKDYLLKPINKEELLTALMRVRDYINKKNGQSSLEREYQLILKNDVAKIRESFLNNLILFNLESFKEYTLKEINENYHFHFQEGLFRIVALRIDALDKEHTHTIKDSIEQTVDKITTTIQNISYEVDHIKDKSNVYVVVNYGQGHQKQIETELLGILKEFKNNITTEEKVLLTLGYGEEVEDVRELPASYTSAQLLIEDRILKGTGKIIKADGVQTDTSVLEEIFYNFMKQFTKAVEILDGDEVKKAIAHFKKEINLTSIRGAQLKKYIHEIVNIYYTTMKNNKIKIEDGPEEWKTLENTLDNCHSMDCIFSEIIEHITSSLRGVAEDKSQNNLRQIRQAKKYIEENYMKNITLEDVGTHIGFNPSYFSSLFKKETGSSFVEYLSKTRIDKAKELLKEPGLRIQDICLMVGYSDAKYFTKLFIKHTGLKPKEYRKIFA